METIYAFTDAGPSYPQYVNICQEDGKVRLIVRSPAKADGTCGDSAFIVMDQKEFRELLAAANAKLK